MNHIEQLQSNFYTIGVKFCSENHSVPWTSKIYKYKVPNEIKIEIGDYIIVRVEGREPEIKVTKVFEVHDGNATDPNAPFKYKWIVQKVELGNYEERLTNDKKLTELVAELKNRKARQSIIDDISSVASIEELNEIKRLSGLV